MEYRMNGFFIAALIIIIGSMVWGYWRGFVRIAFTLVSMILVIVLVSWATPYMADFLKENTSIYESLAQKSAQQIQAAAENTMQNTLENTNSPGGIQMEGMNLPKLWAEEFLNKTGGVIQEVAEDSGIYQQAGEYIADWALRGIAFFVAFFLISILLKLVVGLLDIVTKLPLIKGLNRFFGGVAGLLLGLLIVWLLLFLVAITCTSQWGRIALGYINDSPFLSFLYHNNGILYLLHYILG